jgi:hypothetical protein
MVAIVENVKTRLRTLAMQGMSETLMKMLRMLVTSSTMLQQWRTFESGRECSSNG